MPKVKTEFDGSAWRAARLSWDLLQPEEKVRAVFIAIGQALASLIDTVSLVGVMPLITMIIEPTSVQSKPWIKMLHGMAGEPDTEIFIIQLAVGAVILLGIGIGFNLLMKLVIKRFGIACQERLARDLMTISLHAPYEWFLRQNATSLARLVYSDVLMWSNDGIQRIIAAFGHLTLLFFAISIVFIAAQLAGVAGVAIIGLMAALIMIPIRSRVGYLSQFRRTADAKSMTVANEILGGIKDVKISGRGPAFVEIFMRAFNVYGNSMATLKILQAIPPLVLMFLGQTAIIVIAVTLWYLGSSSGEIAAQMALVLLVTSRIIPATVRLLSEISAMWNVIPHIEGIIALQNETQNKAVREHSGLSGDAVPADWKRVELSRIGFTYGSEEMVALKDFTAVFDRGKSYGIVGPSGAGKTTLIDILLGLLPPKSGAVLIDGEPLSKFAMRSWQQNVGYVPQAPMISDDTLMANVAFGFPPSEIDEDRVLRCLDMANLDEVRKAIGLDGQLGDRGGNLSGGERQRVAIARALYSQPDILVLDEATSALDGLNEREVLKVIKNLHGTITTVTIAHRLTTIKHCDELFLLDKGSLAAQGSYAELIRTSAMFRAMSGETDKEAKKEQLES